MTRIPARFRPLASDGRGGVLLALAMGLGLGLFAPHARVNANLPDTWWAERVFEGDMTTGPRAAPFHAQLEIIRESEAVPGSAFGHCLVTTVARRVFKGAPALKPGDLVVLRAICVGLNEKSAGIPIAEEAGTEAIQGLPRGQRVEAYFHDIRPDQGNAHFTTRLRLIPALTDTPRDPLPKRNTGGP